MPAKEAMVRTADVDLFIYSSLESVKGELSFVYLEPLRCRISAAAPIPPTPIASKIIETGSGTAAGMLAWAYAGTNNPIVRTKPKLNVDCFMILLIGM
jgi:hypothetical protein